MWDVHEAVTWLLSRNPYAGEPVQPRSSYFTIRTTRIGPTPVFTILYLFDEVSDPSHIYLYSICLSDSENHF